MEFRYRMGLSWSESESEISSLYPTQVKVKVKFLHSTQLTWKWMWNFFTSIQLQWFQHHLQFSITLLLGSNLWAPEIQSGIEVEAILAAIVLGFLLIYFRSGPECNVTRCVFLLISWREVSQQWHVLTPTMSRRRGIMLRRGVLLATMLQHLVLCNGGGLDATKMWDLHVTKAVTTPRNFNIQIIAPTVNSPPSLLKNAPRKKQEKKRKIGWKNHQSDPQHWAWAV